MPQIHDTHANDMHLIQTLVYNKCGLTYSAYIPDAESREYHAGHYTVNGRQVTYRAAKITPTKPGLFVAIWKRNSQGITAPLDSTDDMDLLVISTRKGHHFGMFVFPKAALLEQGVMSSGNNDGKRGMRVYPPWETDLNRQAMKTQLWQSAYFMTVDDWERAKVLHG